MKARLELAHKNAKVKKVWLKADTIIGRSTECGLRIASNEVSRQHCKICLGEDGVTVRDLGSSNGTFVNGYQLEPETDYEIAPDSELSVGGIKFFVRFQMPAAKMMQSDGLGPTVDLKPEHPAVPQEADSDSRAGAEATPEAPVPMSETGTVQLTRPRDEDSVTHEPDFEISTHGDSAILEREHDEPNTIDSEADGQGPAAEVDAEDPEPDQAPETTEVPYERLMEEAEKSKLFKRESQPAKDKEPPASPDEKSDADATASHDEETEKPGDEESLGDFFKQFD